nr:uncharacterized protein LOC126054712 [Helicoverpa armigera]
MAQYNFEGDFTSLSERQLEFINKVILDQDLKPTKVIFNPVGQAGDNFIGNVKRINIVSENGTVNMIVKVAASSEIARAVTGAEITFRNEHIMYTEVLPKLVQMQKAAGVPEEDQLRYAKCYGSLYEPPHETLILEDLKDSDFIMLNKLEPLPYDCVKGVLKNFALLHSLSQVMKNLYPAKYEEVTEKLTEALTVLFGKEKFHFQAKIAEADVTSVLDDDWYKGFIENKLIEFSDLMPRMLRQEGNKYSVIRQGDAWTNNFMFRVGDDSVQTVLIDYQVSKNSNPAIDLLVMLLNCTDHEARSKHFQEWMDYYHSEFDKSLSNFGLKATLIYPRDQLDADLKRYAKVMFCFCVVFNTFLMRSPKEAGEIMEIMKNTAPEKVIEALKSKQMHSETRTRIKKRVVGIIDTYKALGFF